MENGGEVEKKSKGKESRYGLTKFSLQQRMMFGYPMAENDTEKLAAVERLKAWL